MTTISTTSASAAVSASTSRTKPPQAFICTYAPRLRAYGNPLLTPVQPVTQPLPNVRTTKRGTTAINYAEDGFDDDDFEDSEGPRVRPTGLRSLRREGEGGERGGSGVGRESARDLALGREPDAPVAVQGIWREWMTKPDKVFTERQLQIQTALPLNLIPIRIDLEIPSFRPEAALPTPANAREFGIDETLPAYRPPDPTPAFRLHDFFLWNLHEALLTPDQFAKKFVDELDFPADRKAVLILQITNQIRTQLEDYAGIAMHPLFHSSATGTEVPEPTKQPHISSTIPSRHPTPLPNPALASISASAPPSDPSTPVPTQSNVAPAPAPVTASAEPIPTNDIHNPDDTYRCIVTLNVNLLNKLYSDKFEWSLLHPPGLAESFARHTCADFGLAGEWVSLISHAIYEAVLRLKKEVCENGGLLLGYGEIANDAAAGAEAGWRYEPDHLAEEWEPRLESLSKEEIEKREGDRERQLRRVRRETARYSSTANVAAGGAGVQAQAQGDYFAVDQGDQPMGRGERSKKKRRFRSLSPLGRDTPDAALAGYGGAVALRDDERQYWRCAHCQVWGAAVWAVRDGPKGQRTLCHNCGFLYERDRRLPPWSKGFFAGEVFAGSVRR